MRTAGARKNAPVRYLPSRPGSAEGGGAAATGGSAVIPPALTSLLALLVRLRRRGFELLCDAARVTGGLEEVLEEPPLALGGGPAEGRRLLVGHVEDDRLRGLDRPLGGLRDRVRVDAGRHVVIAGAEAARLRPRLGGRRRGEVLHERLDRRRVTEGDEKIAGDLDAAVSCGLDRRERERIEPRARLRLRRREDDAPDEVGLEHHRRLRRIRERVRDRVVEAVLERAARSAGD